MLNKLSVGTIRYSFTAIKHFNELPLMSHYLASNKFPFVIVYFTAKWNPYCRITDEHIRELAENYQQVEIIKIDSDVAPKIAKHYLVKAEPEFVFCLNGDEIIRQTGPNKEGLMEKCKTMLEMGEREDLSPNKWTPFGTRFEQYYKKAFGAK
jgi:thiol-disulfide isomerase/thioredoxin